MRAEVVKISEVKVNPNNPRLIKDDKFAKLVQSIKDLPQMLAIRPIVVNADMIVLGGNMRLKACKEAGLKEVPIIIADNLTEEQQREFLIKDNVSGGEWDWQMLANDWDTEQLNDWGLDIPNFEPEQVLEAVDDEFEVPEGGIETDIVLGDLFEIGEHRLLCGDSTDSDAVARLMDGKKADMVFTDPPYGMFLNTDYSQIKGTQNSIGFKGNQKGNKYDKIIGDNEDFTPELINTIFANFNYCKEIFIWGGDYFIDLIPNYGKDGSWFVWNKRTSEAQQRGIGNTFELCWSKTKHKRLVFDFEWFGFLSKDDPKEARNRVHPSMKPSKLLSRLITDYCKGDLLVDLFLGSGSTMVASHQLKRKCYGMELDPKYCQVIVDRMLKLDPSLTIKRNGETMKKQ
jgi:DNA modification methylase